jgi:lysophospholipase L1-like esterase
MPRPRAAGGWVALVLALTLLLPALRAAARIPPPRVAFFGSSTTRGFGAIGFALRWTTTLCRQLGWEELNLGLSYSGLLPNVRFPGAQARLPELLALRPDRVLLVYGANDVVARAPVASFAAEASALAQELADALGRGSVALLSPQPNAAGLVVREPYDQALELSAREVGVAWVDAGKAFPAAELPDLLNDSLHLNGRGHDRFASFLARAMAGIGWAPVVERR